MPPSSHHADIKDEGQISREIRVWSKEMVFLVAKLAKEARNKAVERNEGLV